MGCSGRGPPSLAEALNRVVRDPDLRASLAAAARERVADYTWDRIADRYEELYGSAVS